MGHCGDAIHPRMLVKPRYAEEVLGQIPQLYGAVASQAGSRRETRSAFSGQLFWTVVFIPYHLMNKNQTGMEITILIS